MPRSPRCAPRRFPRALGTTTPRPGARARRFPSRGRRTTRGAAGRHENAAQVARRFVSSLASGRGRLLRPPARGTAALRLCRGAFRRRTRGWLTLSLSCRLARTRSTTRFLRRRVRGGFGDNALGRRANSGSGLAAHGLVRHRGCAEVDDPERQELGWKLHGSTRASATGAHATTEGRGSRSRPSRLTLRSDRHGSLELIGNRRDVGRRRQLPIVSTLPEVDDVGVVRVPQNADEHALVERLAVTAQKVARLTTDVAREHWRVGATGEDVDGPSNEVERLVSREALAAGPDAIARGVDCLRTPVLDRRRCDLHWLRGCRRHRRRLHARLLRAGLALAVPTASATPAATALITTTTTRSIFAGTRLAFRRPGCGTNAIAIRDIDLELTVLELGHLEEATLRGLLRESRELGVAQRFLVEVRVELLHDLLEPVGAHHIPIALHALDGLGHELPRVFLDEFLLARLHQTGQRIVAVVLVAVHDEQVAR